MFFSIHNLFANSTIRSRICDTGGEYAVSRCASSFAVSLQLIAIDRASTRSLIPGKRANAIVTRENSRLIQYIERARNFYGITVIERVPEIIYTKDYIEKNIGINVEYIDNFDEMLKYST
jgi:hypothetical protein